MFKKLFNHKKERNTKNVIRITIDQELINEQRKNDQMYRETVKRNYDLNKLYNR